MVKFLAFVTRGLCWAVLLGLLAAQAGAASLLPESVQQAARAAGVPLEAIGAVVLPLEGREGKPVPLVWHRAEVAMQPASVMKLLPSLAALSLRGPDFRWQTRVYGQQAPVAGRLAGDLYIQGGGDPALTSERLWLLMRELRLRGVRQVAGALVLDRSAYALPPHDPAAFDHEPLRPYNAGADALLVNHGALRLDLEALPGAVPPVRVWLQTPSRWRVENRLQAGKPPCGDWRERLQVTVRREPLVGDAGKEAARVIVLEGELAPACGVRRLYLAPWAQAEAETEAGNAQFADLWSSLWQELGGNALAVRSGTVPPGSELLLRWESPPLAEVVRDTNKFSNNVMARHLLLALDEAQPATPAGGAARLGAWLVGQGIGGAGLVVDNGSGLSQAERLTARQLAEVLALGWRSPVMPELLASLPVAGVDGTLRQRFASAATLGRAHLKTGSLAAVRSLAGYVQDAAGKRHALACMVNHPRATVAICDALANWLAGQR